ncbi:hypothetical protein BC827DRAFT_1156816 [Russula dissimulans]|nr:hypothetical protein BC827DRAFT_1156816 [Russula dissimulans]
MKGADEELKRPNVRIPSEEDSNDWQSLGVFRRQNSNADEASEARGRQHLNYEGEALWKSRITKREKGRGEVAGDHKQDSRLVERVQRCTMEKPREEWNKNTDDGPKKDSNAR